MQNSHAPWAWLLVTGLGLLIIFRERLIKVSFLGMVLELQKTKEALSAEADKVNKLLITCIVSDALPDQRTQIRAFFKSENLGAEQEISQFDDDNLAELKHKGIIDYKIVLDKNGNPCRTQNSSNDSKIKYSVVLKKKIDI